MINRHLWSLFCFVLFTAVYGSVVRADSTSGLQPSPRLIDAYDLGLSSYAPVAAVERLDETIKIEQPTVAKMAALADQTRTDELTGYHDAVSILRRMGAPDEVERPYVDAVSTLDVPLTISDHAKSQVPGDPVAQRVWSTLDEADAMAPDETVELAPWLKLSHGRDGLWAYHLGCLVAAIRANIPGDLTKMPLIGTTQSIVDEAPATTPLYLIDALQGLADEIKARHVYPDAVQAVDHAAATLFETVPNAPAPASPPNLPSSG